MFRFPIIYIVTALVFALMDFGWISWATPNLYRPEIGALLIQGARPVPAVLFYVIYVGAMVALAVAPNLFPKGWLRAGGTGALLGLAAYSAYDLTNQATLTVWSTKVTIADMSWGTFATGAASAVSACINGKLLGVSGPKSRVGKSPA